MNTFDSTTAASGPMVGLIELPELADLLSACGVQVITGPDFRSAATAIRDAFKSFGEFPLMTADVSATSLHSWLASIRQLTKVPVGIVRSGAPVLDLPGAVELREPFSVDSMLAAMGMRPIGGPGGAVVYPYAPAASAAPVLDDPFDAPAAAPTSRRAAREAAAPAAATPVAAEPVSRRARRAQEDPAAEDWDAAPSYQGSPAPRQAPPALSPEEEEEYAAPVFEAPQVYAAPVQQQWNAQPAAPVQQDWNQPAAPQQWEEPAPVQQQWEQPPALQQQDWNAQPAAPVQQDWNQPAAAQQWEEPAPVQQDWNQPPAVQQQWNAQPAAPVQQDWNQPAPAQQWDEPAPVSQEWEQPAPVQDQWNAQPAAPVQQDWNQPPAVQQWEQPAPVQQQWAAQPAAPVQQDWNQPPAVQQWEQPAPAQQQWAAQPAAPIQQDWNQPAPVQQQWDAQPAAPFNQGGPVRDSTAEAFFGQSSPVAKPHQGPLGVNGKEDYSGIFDKHEASKLAGTGRSAAGLGSFIINYSGKGGVGKSTTSLQLARFASDAGMNVILIDGNSGQGDLRTYLRLNRTDLPTIYDAAIGDVRNSVLTPSVINKNREENLGEIKFAFIAAPPDDINDPDVITHDVYRRVIEFARRNADLVIMDTQIIESADRTGVVTQLILPALVHDAWGVGIADMTNVGVNNLNNRLRKFVREEVPVDRLMVMINKVHPEQVEMASKAVHYFTGRATFLGSIEMDAGIHQDMNAGRIGIENKQMRRIMSQILFRVTGNEVFERAAEEVDEAPKGRGRKTKAPAAAGSKSAKAPKAAKNTSDKGSFMDIFTRFLPGKKGE